MTSATNSKPVSKTPLSLHITAETPGGLVELTGLFSNVSELKRLQALFLNEVEWRLADTSGGVVKSLTFEPSYGSPTIEGFAGSANYPGKISLMKT